MLTIESGPGRLAPRRPPAIILCPATARPLVLLVPLVASLPTLPPAPEKPAFLRAKICENPSKTHHRQPSSTLKIFLGHRQAGISVQVFPAQAHMHCRHPHASSLWFFAPLRVFVSSCEAAPVNSFVNFLIAGIPNFTILPLARPPRRAADERGIVSEARKRRRRRHWCPHLPNPGRLS
jgi:hypothetical protein